MFHISRALRTNGRAIYVSECRKVALTLRHAKLADPLNEVTYFIYIFIYSLFNDAFSISDFSR
jgi:hypothetical protein